MQEVDTCIHGADKSVLPEPEPSHTKKSRRDTDEARSNAWSCKIVQAAKKLQPSEEFRRDFKRQRYERRDSFKARVQEVCETLTPCL